ncbi:FecR family protein [Mucilaginibacter angelicae]|uniref:FecR family protein n=1 Tax=Mucilaginibacter angelicae TaxID=869718 RepID=A0ABV6L7W5_9SPHI
MLDKDLAYLLHEESFLNYCFGRNDDDVRYWNKWLADHPEEEMRIEELRRTVIMLGNASHKRLRDKHFEELQQKIAGSNIIPLIAKKKRSIWKPVMAAASVIIVVSTIAVLFRQASKPVKSNTIAQKNDIRPGSNKAVLTLANGQKITLTDSVNGQIAVQANVKIAKTANGQIAYELPNGVTDDDLAPGYNTIEAPTGGQWQVILPDQSRVWLNAKSSLTYPTYFTGNERKVQLKGEAYFEVAHNAKMPFKVSSRGQTVEVLGTHFDIMAYDDDEIMKTTLLEGSVKISNNGYSRILIPGEQAQVSDAGTKVTNDIDLEDVMAWKNGYFKFNDSLENVMRKISRWYNIDIKYANNVDPSLRFGGKISRYKNLSSALKIMELTGNVHFKIEGRRVTVMQ